VFDRYGCNKFCLSLFEVLCLTVTAVISAVPNEKGQKDKQHNDQMKKGKKDKQHSK
jgi:hypothetical protein